MGNEKHDVLIVGVGSIGERHLRCFQATGRTEASLCELNDSLRATVAERYGVRKAHASLDAALAEPPAAAVIAVPAHLHVPMAVKLAEAGVHLLIEKPLSTSLNGIDDLCRIVRVRGLLAAVAYVLRLHPALVAMQAAIREGRFGEPVELVAVAGQHFPTFRPAYRQIYYTDRATGGGAIQDALTHLVNAGEWLTQPVERLAADAAHQVLEGVGVEDTVHLLTRQGPVMGSYSLNQHQAPDELTFTVICRGGTARFESHLRRWRWKTSSADDWHDEPVQSFERDTMFVAQANAFLDAVENRSEPPCTLEEGLQTLRVNLAAIESAETFQWVKV